jgi:hypothetical protein
MRHGKRPSLPDAVHGVSRRLTLPSVSLLAVCLSAPIGSEPQSHRVLGKLRRCIHFQFISSDKSSRLSGMAAVMIYSANREQRSPQSLAPHLP